MFTPQVAPSVQLCLLGAYPAGSGRYSPFYADLEAKNPWSGFVTGLLVNKEAC